MSDRITFGIRDWLRVEVLSRTYEDGGNEYDANWLNVNLFISDSLSQFQCTGPYLLASELQRLLERVDSLIVQEQDHLAFAPMESIWHLVIERKDSLGHYLIRIEISPCFRMSSAEESFHSYTFTGDQSDLQLLAAQLRAALRQFPVIRF